MAGDVRQLDEILQRLDAEPCCPLDQHVEQVGRGQRVGQGPVSRAARQAEVAGQGRQPAVGHLVAQQATGERHRVDLDEPDAGPLGGGQGGRKERDVEAHVVADQHRAPDELLERRQHPSEPRRARDEGVVDARQPGGAGGDRPTGLDQGLERADALAAPELHRAHFGDGVGRRGRAGGLEVDHAESHVVQRRRRCVVAGGHGSAL
jgi:hypothetical protein